MCLKLFQNKKFKNVHVLDTIKQSIDRKNSKLIQKKAEKGTKNNWIKQKTANKMITLNPVISVIILNVNDLRWHKLYDTYKKITLSMKAND